MAQQVRKDWQMTLHKIYKLLYNKRNGFEIEEAAHKREENLCQIQVTRIYRELKKLTYQKSQWPNEETGKWTG
jgi:Fe2+ or Zn2+ uptake regulation protein